MIKPSKFLDLDNSLISITSDIIEILLQSSVISSIELFNKLKIKYATVIDYYYILCLDFLFLLGKINYNKTTDLLELIK